VEGRGRKVFILYSKKYFCSKKTYSLLKKSFFKVGVTSKKFEVGKRYKKGTKARGWSK